MKIDTQAYSATVNLPDQTFASHVVVAYSLDAERKFAGMEFSRIASSTDDSTIPDPGHNFFSFQQELRILNQAGLAFTGPRDDEQELIRTILREAYGQDALVEVTPLQT